MIHINSAYIIIKWTVSIGKSFLKSIEKKFKKFLPLKPVGNKALEIFAIPSLNICGKNIWIFFNFNRRECVLYPPKSSSAPSPPIATVQCFFISWLTKKVGINEESTIGSSILNKIFSIWWSLSCNSVHQFQNDLKLSCVFNSSNFMWWMRH